MSKSNPELKYPIASNVLIDYIKKTSVYPVYMGTDFICFSTEPFLGGKNLPSNIKIHYGKLLTRNEVENVLEKLNLQIDDFEVLLKGSL